MADVPPESARSTAPSAETAFTSLWRRLSEHKVLQWGLGYVGAAIAIAHGQELMASAFGWPHLIGRVVMSVLVAGLPIALALAWYHGHKGLKGISSGEMTVLALLVLVGAGLLVFLVREPAGHAPETAAEAAKREPEAGEAAHRATESAISLAVLPFANLSPEPDQEYFSDGLSEELLNQIAQMKSLRVIARASSFAFKGKNEDLRVIGKALGVNHLLEGSVRRAGKRLRITAELVRAADGSSRWSASYDRTLDDVFQVQEDIARDVANALRITLGVGDTVRPIGGTTNLAAYDSYLRARALSNELGAQPLLLAIEAYRKAVMLDPGFALAWYGLYTTAQLATIYNPEHLPELQNQMAEARARVQALAPESWWTHSIRANELQNRRQWAQAEVDARAALGAAPSSDTDAAAGYATALASVGRVEEAIRYLRQARETDPLSLYLSGGLQLMLDTADRFGEAQQEYVRSRTLAGDHLRWDWFALVRHWHHEGDPKRIEAFFRTEAPLSLNVASPSIRRVYETIARDSNDAGAIRAAIQAAYKDSANQDVARVFLLAFIADHYGEKDVLLGALRRGLEQSPTQAAILWFPWQMPVRSDPQFLQLVRDLGIADYWRESGKWADRCRAADSPQGFVCQ